MKCSKETFFLYLKALVKKKNNFLNVLIKLGGAPNVQLKHQIKYCEHIFLMNKINHGHIMNTLGLPTTTPQKGFWSNNQLTDNLSP